MVNVKHVTKVNCSSVEILEIQDNHLYIFIMQDA